MTYPWWPLSDLHLATPDLTLRPMREADLAAVARLLPEDVEQDPRAIRYQVSDSLVSRGIVAHQSYWSAWGYLAACGLAAAFRGRHGGPGDRRSGTRGRGLPDAAHRGQLVVPDQAGTGPLGTQMRRAVLALAFGPLGAQAAITSAWHDSHASLGVSRALGYQPNGQSLHPRGEHPDVMLHMLLRRADWLVAGSARGVTISGFGGCPPLFGLPAD